jgi:hypothetical protein
MQKKNYKKNKSKNNNYLQKGRIEEKETKGNKILPIPVEMQGIFTKAES